MEAIMGNYRALLNTYSPQKISFTDPQAREDIYNRHENKPEFTRNPPSWLPGLSKTPSIFNVDGEHYQSFHMLVSKALSPSAVQSYEPLVLYYTDSLVSEITRKAQPVSGTGVVNIASWLSFTTYDIMHHLCLGEPSRCLETGRHQAWLDLRFRDPQSALGDVASHLVPALAPSWNARLYSMLNTQAQATFQALHTSFEKPRDETAAKTFATIFGQSAFTDPNIRTQLEETLLLMHIKGSEATATVLSGILHYLIKATSLDLVTGEVRSAFNSSSDITNDRLRDLPYLNAVISEGLRLCSPFPASFTRHVPVGGATVCGRYLTANTPVSIDRSKMCRAASSFSEPGAFRPERWLKVPSDGSSEKVAPQIHDENAFHPFGHGSGMCLGNDLALMMMRLILAKLLWHFDLLQAEPMLSWESQKGEVMVERRPWNLCLRLKGR